MPVQVLRGSARVLKNSLPSYLQKVDFEHLQLGCDCANKYVQGTVVELQHITGRGNRTSFKTVLQESENSDSGTGTINTFMFGKLAEDCAKVTNQGDIMIVTGFSLAESNSENDKHCCQLEVSDEAGSIIYISSRSSRTAAGSETVAMPVSPKYTYTPLNRLKGGTVVNVYGAVKFFKPPYICKGTDFCSVITIVDQSNAKLICTLFNANKNALPEVYRNGDIVRFHRIKVSEFNGQLQGLSNCGFAALTFDGTIGAPLTPRSTSKLFTFTDEDKKTVENLRIWVASNFQNSAPSAKLSHIQQSMYFELTCQLVGKAKVDGSSYLLKVWDGTKCPFPSWKVLVKEDDLEGDGILINQLRNLTVDIVVYDNHVQLAKSLKVGSFIRMYNLHAKPQGLEGRSDISYIQFHLHGGTGYGRGIIVLPESYADVKELKAFLDSVEVTENECSEGASSSELEHTYGPLGSYMERCQQLSVTVLTDHQHFDTTALATIMNSRIPQPYRIRAKLTKFEPKKLYQSVKLHCPQCNLLAEVPDEAELDSLLQEASATCSNSDLLTTSFCEAVAWDTENKEQQRIVVHFVKHDDLLRKAEDGIILIEGGTRKDILKLSKIFKGIITVRSTEDNLMLLDLSAPFFWQENMQYYGLLFSDNHCGPIQCQIDMHIV